MPEKTPKRRGAKRRIGSNPNGTASNPVEVPDLLAEVVNCKPEQEDAIQQFATQEGVALIAFIAPNVGVRVSPVEEARATISLADEFGVEALVKELEAANVKKAYLLVNSPGGAMGSSYKVARAIRSCLDEIVTFVPSIAASGGTLLTLTGDKIVMGPMSHITPLDVQLYYKGARISAATFMRSFARISEWFKKITPEEAPYPQTALADKLDPFIMEEWNGLMETMVDYVGEILRLTKYDDHENIAMKIVTGYPTHNYVINPEKAKDLGLNVEASSGHQEAWDVMRYWLSHYIFAQEMTHCIRYVIPQQPSEDGQAQGEGASDDTEE